MLLWGLLSYGSFRIGWVTRMDDLAYDGSNEPQKRELTARERDILVRMLSDVIYGLRTQEQRAEVRVSYDEFQHYINIRKAIDPRSWD